MKKELENFIKKNHAVGIDENFAGAEYYESFRYSERYVNGKKHWITVFTPSLQYWQEKLNTQKNKFLTL
jgi:hypothetical protein